MNVGDYVAGSIALAVTTLPWAVASSRLQRRIAPDWDLSAALLARAVIAPSGVLVVAELVGLAGELRRWPLAIASLVVAVLVTAAGRPASTGSGVRRIRLPDSPRDRILAGCVVVCVLSITAVLIGRDARVLHTGPNDLDSLHYHLTQAAQIVQTHSLDHLHQTASSDGTLYYPFNVELLDAVAMVGPRPDLVTLGLNLLFGWLALLACWVIGARWSVGAAGVAGGSAVLALPIVAGASSGPGLNDIPGAAMLLAGIGCLLVAGLPRADRTRGRWSAELALAGLALGFAAGTKLPVVAPVLLVGLGAVVLCRGDRLRAALVLTGSGIATGGFWYLRDWVIVGSPQPSLTLQIHGHGLTHVPYPEVAPYSFTVAHYLGNYGVIRHWFVPGLKVVWTDAWPLVAVLMALGAVLAVAVDRSAPRRMLGIVAILGFGAYLVTPTTAIGSPGEPVLFATNTRYAIPVLALAMVLFATSRWLRPRTVIVTPALTALVVVLLLLSKFSGKVASGPGTAGAVLAAAVAALVWVVLGRWPSRRTPLVLGLAGIVVLIAAGGVIQRQYLKHRYAAATDPGNALYAYVGALSHQRIGLSGHGLQYPFYGPTFSNEVNYVGVTAPDKAFDAPQTCPALIRVLAAAHDDFFVIEPLALEHTVRLMAWTAAIPGVHEVFSTGLGTVYRLPPHVTATGCAVS